MSVRVWERSVKRKSRGVIVVCIRHKRNHSCFEILIDKKFRKLIDVWDFNVSKRKRDGRLRVRLNKIGSVREKIELSRLLMECPNEMLVDHINGNPLDNRVCNLRITDCVGNGENRTVINKNNTSGVRGVSWDRRNRKWKAQVSSKGVHRYLGLHGTLEEASRVVSAYRAKHMPFSKDAA